MLFLCNKTLQTCRKKGNFLIEIYLNKYKDIERSKMTNGLTATTNFIAQKIDRNMVDAVTNAIFERAASKSSQAVEASASHNEYNNNIFKTTVQNEVMAEARKSMVQAANPFAEGIFKSQGTQAAASTNATEAQAGAKAISSNAVRVNTKARVSNSMALQNGLFTSAIRESIMVQAKEQISNNNDLMSRLQFLNSKTAVNTYPAKQFN